MKPSKSLPKITEQAFERALRLLREGSKKIDGHKKFEELGGTIQWVIDTDVCKFFLAPKENIKYADLFSTYEFRDESEIKSLEALAYLLGDFIFSKRLKISEKSKTPKQIILEPHAIELHEIIQEISKKASRQIKNANPIVDGTLKDSINELIRSYVSGKDQVHKDQEINDFVEELCKLIDQATEILQPTGPLTELKRAKSLLESRGLLYQADSEDKAIEELDNPNTKSALDDLSINWFFRLKDFFIKKNVKEREDLFSKRLIQRYRDAEVLAILNYLNKKEKHVRYVLITGTNHLNGLIQSLESESVDHNIHLLHPLHFLNNSHLLDTNIIPEHASPPLHQWKKQMTDALSLPLEKRSGEKLQEQLPKIFEKWKDLENLAKPYLPVHLPEESEDRKAILSAIFSEDSLEFLEIKIYLAVSDFFVLTADLGLGEHKDAIPNKIPLRKPPPLLLIKYPIAEGLICDLVERKFWSKSGQFKGMDFTKKINDVKAEQLRLISKKGAPSNFNYTLLLCYAARYATLDDWHACRIMAAHAKSVAKVLKDEELRGEEDFITGREAAFLEAYSRRLDARDESDLEKASAALEDFKTACVKEKGIDNGENNFIVEFELHALRLKVERICIRFSELAFYCFKEHNLASIEFLLKERQQDWKKLLDECLTTQTKLSKFQNLDTQSRSFVASIKFMSAQLSLCALQCGIFMHRVPNTQCEPKIADPLFLEEIEEHGTEVSILMVSIAKYLWLGGDIEIVNEKIKEHRSALSKKKESQNDRFPHDHGRLIFLESLIGEKNE